MLVYGIIKGGELATFAEPEVLVPVLAGVALLALFVWYERRSDHPSLDVQLFRNPQVSTSVAAIGLVFFAMMGALFFLIFYLQIVRGFSPLQAGLWFLPFAAAQMVFAPLAGNASSGSVSVPSRTFGLSLLTLRLAATS